MFLPVILTVRLIMNPLGLLALQPVNSRSSAYDLCLTLLSSQYSQTPLPSSVGSSSQGSYTDDVSFAPFLGAH